VILYEEGWIGWTIGFKSQGGRYWIQAEDGKPFEDTNLSRKATNNNIRGHI
jgi:hypothetical protein